MSFKFPAAPKPFRPNLENRSHLPQSRPGPFFVSIQPSVHLRVQPSPSFKFTSSHGYSGGNHPSIGLCVVGSDFRPSPTSVRSTVRPSLTAETARGSPPKRSDFGPLQLAIRPRVDGRNRRPGPSDPGPSALPAQVAPFAVGWQQPRRRPGAGVKPYGGADRAHKAPVVRADPPSPVDCAHVSLRTAGGGGRRGGAPGRERPSPERVAVLDFMLASVLFFPWLSRFARPGGGRATG